MLLRVSSLGARLGCKMCTNTALQQQALYSKVFMKLGRNGRLFYRLCAELGGQCSMAIFVEETIQQDPNLSAGTLDKQLTAFSMHIKGAIVECSSELALRPCTGQIWNLQLAQVPLQPYATHQTKPQLLHDWLCRLHCIVLDIGISGVSDARSTERLVSKSGKSVSCPVTCYQALAMT